MSKRMEFENISLYPPYCVIHSKQFQQVYGTTMWHCKDCQRTIELSIKDISKK
jgi:hypothetical protein